ncbi:hypothetical protein BC831DRAFT_459882 [Entophlyctis helioformis]|nr:hypothetical protein BC831DRAFT_459882 [Entophlyctis helioformis]
MAKGLRSKSQRKAKAVRREMIHGPVEDQRVIRLAAKLAETAAKPVETTMAVDSASGETRSRSRSRARAESAATIAASSTSNFTATAMDVEDDASKGEAKEKEAKSDAPLTKDQKDRLFMSRRGYRKKKIAAARSRSASKKR